MRDNPVAAFIKEWRHPLPDASPMDLAGLVPASGQHTVYCSSAGVKAKLHSACVPDRSTIPTESGNDLRTFMTQG
jgi:hypothetical protein